ncbi:MAG: hypothetical protein H7326_10245 [Bdellovibrionaceae bacterium]|nr:hypothetical protein [Pseudobdellovibrionaceae bacterium]
MLNELKVLIVIAAVATVAGCKTVKIENGEVPSQYLSEAKKLEGTYRGSFNGVRGDLVIRFEGNRPIVQFKNNNGNDILNNNCNSDVGLLRSVTVKSENKNPRVSNATFAFDAGRCSLSVEGREISIGMKDKSGDAVLNVSILQETRSREVCGWDSGAPPNIPPRQVCRTEFQSYYLTGSFSR